MIALDSNVLVRFLTQDDAPPAIAALEVMTGLAGLCTDAPRRFCCEGMIERVWVLKRADV